MLTAKVKGKGLSNLKNKAERRLPTAIERGSEAAVREETREIAQEMRNEAPVLTGELVAGIQAEFRNGRGQAVSTARYTKYVVNGTSSTPAQDFMTGPAMRGRQRFPKTVVRNVRSEIRKAVK